MLNEELRKLGAVQKVDAAIVELKRRFAAIDPGGKVSALRNETETTATQSKGHLSSLRGELADLELEQKKLEQKVESEQKRLYSGGIYNAKDADAIEREVKNLKERIGKIDERILQLWEEIPPAEERAEREHSELEKAEGALSEYQQKYTKLKAEYESKLSSLFEKRRQALVGCDEELLSKYEAVRQKKGGIGLSSVADGQCAICRSSIPKIQFESVVAGKALETCEACGRYLYIDNGA